MKILIITSSIIDYLSDLDSSEIADRIKVTTSQFEKRYVVVSDKNKLPKDWDKYEIRAEIIQSNDLFLSLSEMSEFYKKCALFILMHNHDNELIDQYLTTKYSTKICFLDMSPKENKYHHMEMSDKSNPQGLTLHSKNDATYKYRNLTATQESSIELKIYEFPGINIH